MKRIYSMLGPMGAKLRNVLEFDGGITDTYLHPNKPGLDTWNVITHGRTGRYRIPPGSLPQARLPNQATPDRNYDIKYFPRDVRRNRDPALNVPIENSFTPEVRALLEGPETGKFGIVGPVDKAAPPPGSNTGMKNPDVARYDVTGLRNTMTASLVEMNKSLAANRAVHLPRSGPALPNRPRVKRLGRWSQAQMADH